MSIICPFGSCLPHNSAFRFRVLLPDQAALFDRGYLLKFLHNKVYRGLAVHKGEEYPGEHKAIIIHPPATATARKSRYETEYRQLVPFHHIRDTNPACSPIKLDRRKIPS